MALDLDLEGFGILESDSEATSKLSPTLNKQPPISPIESESSSGISSLDSDDLKKQLLASPPTISQEDHDDEEEDQSDSDSSSSSSSNNSTKSDEVTDQDSDEKDEVEEDDDNNNDAEEQEKVDHSIIAAINEIVKEDSIAEEEVVPNVGVIGDAKIYPSQVMYENRNILNLAENIWSLGHFVNYTVLPENNVNCFFQNRAQYWRLANTNEDFDVMEKCDCCGFAFPAQINSNLTGTENGKNPITDSLKTFLKNNYVDQQNPIAPPPQQTMSNMPQSMNNMPFGGAGVGGYNNNNNMNNKRMYNNGGVPYAAYQMIQQQQQQQQQQYQNNGNQNGFYGNGYNPYNNNNNTSNNAAAAAGGYNGTALALLNLMNASRNVSGAAFQATMNNSSRYYNNVNTSNNGFGLYKQF